MPKVRLQRSKTQEQGKKGVSLLAYLEILRPSVTILAILGVIVGALVAGFYNPFMIAVGLVVVFLVTGAGDVINDYFDYKIDKINKPKRPIPSGRISLTNAKIYFLALLLLANALAFTFLNIYVAALTLLNSTVAFLYSWKIKGTPFGHFVDSWLAASTFLFGGLLGSGLPAIIVILMIMSFCVNFAREIAKALEDEAGDRKFGLNTLPIAVGKHIALLVSIVFVLFGIIFSLLPYVFKLMPLSYLVGILVADLVVTYGMFVMFFNPASSQRIFKLAMFVAIAAFIIGLIRL